VQSVLHVPGCKENNLLLVSQLDQVGIGILFDRAGARMNRNGKCIAELTRLNGLYVIHSGSQPPLALTFMGSSGDELASL
jgi:hypothetical protein